MSDLISRQDAFRAVLGVTTYDTVDDVEIHCDASVADSEGWLGGVRDALRAIEYVPSAETERRWIPVSEALPKNYEQTICIDSRGKMMIGMYGEYGWTFPCYMTEPVAWMPLPEPWRGEQ